MQAVKAKSLTNQSGIKTCSQSIIKRLSYIQLENVDIHFFSGRFSYWYVNMDIKMKHEEMITTAFSSAYHPTHSTCLVLFVSFFCWSFFFVGRLSSPFIPQLTRSSSSANEREKKTTYRYILKQTQDKLLKAILHSHPFEHHPPLSQSDNFRPNNQ